MIDKIMAAIARGSNMIGAAALLIMLGITVADVFMNKVLGEPFAGTSELIIAVMPISVFGFLLSTQIQGRHISIDVITMHFTKRVAAVFALIAQSVGLFLFGLLTYLNIPLAINSVVMGEHTGGNVPVPIYPAKVMIPIATALISIQLIIELCRTLRVIFTGRENHDAQVKTA